MSIPVGVATTIASQIPWKDVISAAPEVWKSARDLFSFATKRAEGEPIDPTAELREQVSQLAARVHEGEQALAAQAKVTTELAQQLQAITHQLQMLQSRATRLIWIASGASGIAVIALVTAFMK